MSKTYRPSSSELPTLRKIASYSNGLSFVAATRQGVSSDRLEELTRKGLIHFKDGVYHVTSGAKQYL